ncbi:amidohydrolase family protein [Rubinisphaera italica]|nr:amidohydrolase family protein [Rubinisphaera italica]
MIDSHHHFWNYSSDQYPWIGEGMQKIAHSFLPQNLIDVAQPSGISGVISVQARQTLDETSWLLELAEDSDFIRGVVGWVPLKSKDLTSTLDQYAHHPKLVGVRHVVQDETDGFLLDSVFNRGIDALLETGLVYDLLMFPHQLKESIQFVDLHPEQVFVLDHLAKPRIHKDHYDSDWARDIKDLAKRQNVSVKFSGLTTEVKSQPWSVAMLKPYWDMAIEAFGPQRIMYGSDWPVCLLETEYNQWVDAVKEFAGELSQAEHNQFFRENCEKAYELKTTS